MLVLFVAKKHLRWMLTLSDTSESIQAKNHIIACFAIMLQLKKEIWKHILKNIMMAIFKSLTKFNKFWWIFVLQCYKLGPKSFACSICDKPFPCNADVIRHIRIHTGKKPFICQYCSYAANQKGSLKSIRSTWKSTG